MNFRNILCYRPGPGMLVSAAFIGPGTVTAASMAGAQFGYALLWALIFATIATIILQSFVTRITIVTNQELGQVILSSFGSKSAKTIIIILLLSALLIGNAAYEAGNISGAALGLNELMGSYLSDNRFSPFFPTNAIGMIALSLLLFGNVDRISKMLILLVVLMSISFLAVFIITKPDLSSLINGVVPSLPNGSIFTAIALIGTTIVPYNLFLYASNVHKKWTHIDQLEEAKTESAISISIGGLVSIAILASAANIFVANQITLESLDDMALQVEPLFGIFASKALALGLLAAGLTSALTAPLATAYIVMEIWKSNEDQVQIIRFKSVACAIVVIGIIVSMFQVKPISIILFAQVANGLLLPFVAIFLVKISMSKAIMGQYVNNKFQNIAAIIILLVTFALGLRLILRTVGIIA